MSAMNLVLGLVILVAAQIAIALWLRSAWRDDRGSGARRTDGAGARDDSGTGPAGRRADDFRSYQAVASEVAKRQVAVLADMAEELQAYDRACLVHARRLCELVMAEQHRSERGGSPESLPSDLDAAMRSFVQLAQQPLDDGAQSRIRKDMAPNATVLLTYAEQTTSRLEENRFWLGMTLERELRAYVSGMGKVFADLHAAPEALRAGADRYRALLLSHPEASRAIEHLSASTLPDVPGSPIA